MTNTPNQRSVRDSNEKSWQDPKVVSLANGARESLNYWSNNMRALVVGTKNPKEGPRPNDLSHGGQNKTGKQLERMGYISLSAPYQHSKRLQKDAPNSPKPIGPNVEPHPRDNRWPKLESTKGRSDETNIYHRTT
jgi:hypothetical protein